MSSTPCGFIRRVYSALQGNADSLTGSVSMMIFLAIVVSRVGSDVKFVGGILFANILSDQTQRQ